MNDPPQLFSIEFETIRKTLRNTILPDTDLVVAIGSGGVAFATMVAYKVNAPMSVMWLNYRGPNHQPLRSCPELCQPFHLPQQVENILLVDDVVVSGETMEAAKDLLPEMKITTLTLKGTADIVLFPEITSCVQWPWNPIKSESIP